MQSGQNGWREAKDWIKGYRLFLTSAILMATLDTQMSKSSHTVANARLGHALV